VRVDVCESDAVLAGAARAEEAAKDVAAVPTNHDGEAAIGKHCRLALGEQMRVSHEFRLVAHATGRADEIAVRLRKHVAGVAGAECGAEPDVLERRRIRASPVVFEIPVEHRPARVAIDPYYKLIDRDRGNNVRAVLSAGAPAGR
jgi:hypothetical protein